MNRNEKFQAVRAYIANSWQKAVKKRDANPDFPLPYDYIPPCVDGDLINLFYWDTYFTNIGLYLDGMGRYALNNIEDLKFCLRKFGCVPNMCRGNGADYASQPPLLCLMIEDYFAHTGDLAFLEDGYFALCKEYEFWRTKRSCANGLNRYGTNYDYAGKGADLSEYEQRTGLDFSAYTKEEKVELCENRTAEGESGEDHTPRFFGRAKYINPIDLNCYLYAFETRMAKFSALLGKGEEKKWTDLATVRLALLRKYCFDEETGLYFDYDYLENKRTKVYCVGCYLPFAFGISDDKEALARLNGKLVCAHGVVSCEEIPAEKEMFQWGYPNAWAPHQYWAYVANARLHTETAKSVAVRYMENIADDFATSGKLFEKYDAVKGGPATVNEYGLPEMLGWTAGVYNYFFEESKRWKEK